MALHMVTATAATKTIGMRRTFLHHPQNPLFTTKTVKPHFSITVRYAMSTRDKIRIHSSASYAKSRMDEMGHRTGPWNLNPHRVTHDATQAYRPCTSSIKPQFWDFPWPSGPTRFLPPHYNDKSKSTNPTQQTKQHPLPYEQNTTRQKTMPNTER